MLECLGAQQHGATGTPAIELQVNQGQQAVAEQAAPSCATKAAAETAAAPEPAPEPTRQLEG